MPASAPTSGAVERFAAFAGTSGSGAGVIFADCGDVRTCLRDTTHDFRLQSRDAAQGDDGDAATALVPGMISKY